MKKPILTRKLVSDAEAEPVKTQHRKPCADCPFARTALPGWLGSYSLDQWVKMVHGEEYINCHCTTNQQCAGAAIFRANIIKMVRWAGCLQLPKDKVLVFANTQEFTDHHSSK